MARRADKAAREARRLFEEAMADGRDYREACQLAGVSERTGRRWRRRPGATRGTAPANPGRAGTSFEGRAAELAELTEHFERGARLVSVVGPPGVGKTRLVQEWAATESLPDEWGVPVFCDLRYAETEYDLVTLVARNLGLPLVRSGEAEALRSAMETRGETFLVLDNFEQLLDAATVVTGWLDQAPNLRVLVTSRRILHLSAEHVLEIKPLEIPAKAAPAQEVRAAPAVRLLWERARAAEPGLALDNSSAVTLGEIARLVEGIPLSLELAATRLVAVTPEELAEEIRRDQLHLVNRWQDCDPGHATLEKAIERSWRLLSRTERRVLAALTIFRSGFTLDAAESVLATKGLSRSDVSRTVLALRDASLITLPDGTRRRWDILESIRQFGATHLSDPRKLEARSRHAEFYLRHGERWLAQLTTAEGTVTRKRLNAELHNLQAAFEEIARHEVPGADRLMRMGCVLHEALTYVIPFAAVDVATRALGPEARSGSSAAIRIRLLFRRAVSSRVIAKCSESASDLSSAELLLDASEELSTAESESLRAELEFHRGCLCRSRGLSEQSREDLESALKRVKQTADRSLEARIRTAYGRLLAETFGDEEAFDHFQRALAFSRTTGDAVTEAEISSLDLVFRLFFSRGIRPEDIQAQAKIMREAGLQTGETYTKFVLALRALDRRDLDSAESLATEAFRSFRPTNLRVAACCALIAGNVIDERDADLDKTEPWYQTALHLFERSGDVRLEAVTNAFLATTIARRGDPVRAERLLDEASKLLATTGDRRLPHFVELQRAWVDLGRAKTNDDPERRAIHMGDARRRSEAASKRLRRPAGSRAIAETCLEARVALRILAREIDSLSDGERALVFASDASWFRISNGDPVSVPHGVRSRRLLLALAEERAASPGRPLSTTELVERCWPGEKMTSDSGPRRLRDLVRRLRLSGLRNVIKTGPDGGYQLDPTLPFRFDHRPR